MNQGENEEKIKDRHSIENIIEELKTYVINELPKSQIRLNNFIEIFNKEFSFDDDPYKKGAAEALTWAIMSGPLILFALGMNGSAIIELHSILERIAIREVKVNLSIPKKSSTLSRLIERYGLLRSARILKDLGILNEEDVKFTEKITKLRNAVAHKNPKKISNLIGSEEEISWLDIPSAMSKFDCTIFIIDSINLLYEMSQMEDKKKDIGKISST